jgi:hypothetical protein
MTYTIFLYDDVRKSYSPVRIVDETQIEHSKKFYWNDCGCLPEWQSYVVTEFDKDGYPTNRETVINKNLL